MLTLPHSNASFFCRFRAVVLSCAIYSSLLSLFSESLLVSFLKRKQCTCFTHTELEFQKSPELLLVLIYSVSFSSQTRACNVCSLVLPGEEKASLMAVQCIESWESLTHSLLFLTVPVLGITSIVEVICKQGAWNSPPPPSFNETNLHAKPKPKIQVASNDCFWCFTGAQSHPFILSVSFGMRIAIAELLWRQLFLHYIHSGWKYKILHERL